MFVVDGVLCEPDGLPGAHLKGSGGWFLVPPFYFLLLSEANNAQLNHFIFTLGHLYFDVS